MQYKSPYSQCRPSSASRASRPRPCSARPASRPSSARPQSARTRPQSARPSSGRPSSGRPASAKVPAPPRHGIRPQSAPTCMEMRHHSCASIKPRPASAMPAARCPDDKGVSILFQQQQFLEKQMAEQGLHAQAPGFATLMQDWLASYQKSRVRARMACRPLWGEGAASFGCCLQQRVICHSACNWITHADIYTHKFSSVLFHFVHVLHLGRLYVPSHDCHFQYHVFHLTSSVIWLLMSFSFLSLFFTCLSCVIIKYVYMHVPHKRLRQAATCSSASPSRHRPRGRSPRRRGGTWTRSSHSWRKPWKAPTVWSTR